MGMNIACPDYPTLPKEHLATNCECGFGSGSHCLKSDEFLSPGPFRNILVREISVVLELGQK
jgi:hypothetical protein